MIRKLGKNTGSSSSVGFLMGNRVFRRDFRLLVAACAVLLVSTTAAHGSARTILAEPLDAPQFAPPPIRMAASAPSTAGKKARPLPNDISPLALKPSGSLLRPANASTTCPVEASETADPNNAASGKLAGVSTPLQRLRATASGSVLPENRQLSKPRFQRLQATAAWQLGLLTLHGICVVLNTGDAAVWFQQAYDLGEPLAPAGLAWCEIEGCKSAANPAAAVKWIELLRAVDLPRANYLQYLVQTQLAPLELARSGASSAGAQSRQLLADAARLGDTNAKIELGLESVAANNLAQAQAFFNSAGSRSVAATLNSAVIADRLKVAARTLPANRSPNIAPGRPQSANENFTQAQRYHKGQGVPSNYTEAIRLYQLAKNQGSMPARKMLELIFSRPGPDGNIDLGWMQQLATVALDGAVPKLDAIDTRQQLKREPTPLFELVPGTWRKFAATAVSA